MFALRANMQHKKLGLTHVIDFLPMWVIFAPVGRK